MKSKFLLLFLSSAVLFSCSKDPNELLKHINGYWEIQEVTLSDGTKKEYTYNDTVEYIEISDNTTGFRTKLKPNLEGTYTTSTDKEGVSVKISNDSLHLIYSTPYSEWKETVLNANETELLIVNANKDMYLYKRYEPINMNASAQKN
ncbi:lipocalin family protein [Psychroserpens sp. XS_ASV72]|uniref:lipocalin family protein n=1 Tax=Psychroserpens sp. XS_ASV72 TaxID=3241293 RepID=UPI003511A12F